MQKFERLQIEDQVDLALEGLRVMGAAKCPTLKQLIAKRDCTPAELWREIYEARGIDECEPWPGWPKFPQKDYWATVPGVDRPLPPYLAKLLNTMKEITGQDKH